ncbi:MAG: 5-deoxy-glucuronate isomerase [Acidimicrobiia bacterium]|nr:5-deoxy-glucuronate isomerase [Acidimicrobiia bacterium]MBA3982232.1 5-deoxy-glucuronate isomerase [Acidimicrobiia bacterium]
MTTTAAHPWHRRAGSATGVDGVSVDVTPVDAGWAYSGLLVRSLAAGERVEFSTGTTEMAVIPLAGALRVEVESHRFDLAGRASVFERVSDWAYVPIDAEVRLTAPGAAEVALPSAVATTRFEPAYVAAGDVAVEVRGAGPATRQVTNFMSPERFADADKLMCVELLTPDGNWSSYPPHRHDDSPECPVNNEEIYYFRIGRAGTTEYAAEGFGLHRTYTPDGEVDINVRVGDGDVFLIPRGYHGPCVAAPGYPMYYLNVLAGPGGERSMAFCDDPSHHWVRETWESMDVDRRCPMTTANGVSRERKA